MVNLFTELISFSFKAWNNDDSIGCVVIKGAGEKAFCAGGDVKCKIIIYLFIYDYLYFTVYKK